MLRILFLLLVLVPFAATAGQLDALRGYFESVDTLRGTFTQVTLDEYGAPIEEAGGSFAIHRPDRFDWVYETPYEQRIVADGRWLYVHDVGLEQVSIRPLEEVLGVGPAVLLSGEYEQLTEAFEIEAGEDGWIRLRPTSEEWDFESVRLRLVDGIPAVVEVADGLGETTRVELNDLERNVELASDLFRFEPPEGVDVIKPPGYSSGE